MTNSENSSNTSKVKAFQIPLKGFMVRLESQHPKREIWVEGMGEKRVRIHVRKIK